MVAEGSLFPRLRGLIGESGQRKVHRTVAISISHKHSKKLSGPERFWKMRSTKCAQHCSESSISHKNCKKTVGLGALLEDEVGKMCTRV